MNIRLRPVSPDKLRPSSKPLLKRSVSLTNNISELFGLNKQSARKDIENEGFNALTEEERNAHLAIKDGQWTPHVRGEVYLWAEGIDNKIITLKENEEGRKRNHAEIYNQVPIYNAGEIVFGNDKISHFPRLC